MIDIYQFIKYNSETSAESIAFKAASGAVICFDLEDSICNWIDQSKTTNLKKEYRKTLNRILNDLKSQTIDAKIGVRFNSYDSQLQNQDIDSLPAGSHINSILIPKVEKSCHIDDVVFKLESKNIIFNEIIPLIESKKGIENLEEILRTSFQIKKVGFGHCDYNLSINAFPFFHQDTIEYWKWVNRIISIIQPLKIKFINSAYLKIRDSDFFLSILSNLQLINGDEFGQFTLNHHQTNLCKNFNHISASIKGDVTTRFDLKITRPVIASLISDFELGNNGQAFTISTEKKVLISPQEYCSAKQRVSALKEKDFSFTFVGGCFPVQHNILFEDTFHQVLKRSVEQYYQVNFNIGIIRYERFSDCLEKINNHASQNDIDLLVFHIRPEPFLRLIKFYYKYLQNNHKLRRSLNLPFLRLMNPEKHDILQLSRRYSYAVSDHKSKLYKTLINLNYLVGFLMGNYRYALTKYMQLTNSIIDFCKNQNIRIIILGPAIRSNTFFEKVFSKKLDKYMSKSVNKINIDYLSGLVEHVQNGKIYFNKNGIHATELYHDLVAERLYKNIKKKSDIKNEIIAK